MQSYSPGTPVVMNFPLEDDAGSPIAPSSYRWRVTDEAGAVVQDWQTIGVSDAAALNGVITITIPGTFTVLGVGQVRGAREVSLEITQGAQTLSMSDAVLIRGSTSLAVGQNSLITYLQASLIAEDLSPKTVLGWESTISQAERERALIEAYRNLDRCHLKLELDSQTRVVGWRGDRIKLSDFDSAIKLSGLDADFLAALKRAQIIEASEILRSDEVAMARENGLMSLTVGESSQFFQSSKPLPKSFMPISQAAYAQIAKWMVLRVGIGRS